MTIINKCFRINLYKNTEKYVKIYKESVKILLEELEKLITFIQQKYIEFNEKWEKSEYYKKINLKKNEVSSILENEEILNTIFKYREFINENNIQLSLDFKQFNNDNTKVNIRTKTKNSIEYKIKNYIQNHEDGKIPINKCLNDLFGMRIIFKENITNQEIMNNIQSKYNNLKCIDSSKQGYKATHIYFKQDNFLFQWELQIWNKIDEINNINSHEKYKQDYIKWERENKGSEKLW